MIGTTLGHYRVTSLLGRGGMGEVYLAEDTKLGRQVALKTLPTDLAQDATRRERFLNEARALAAINHPHIVTIYSLDEVDGCHFLCMELIQGSLLDEDIPPEGYPPERWLEVALPLAEALAAAHELHVVHRDLKPANIMFHRDGRLKVLDFGLATFTDKGPSEPSGDETVEASNPLTGDGTILGTVPYMSPEQIEGKAVDARSDVFSLGVILYQMATGKRPFHGDSNAALMSSILRDNPAPVTHMAPRFSEEVDRVLHRCLEKDPQRRYQTMRDVFNELDGARVSLDSERAEAPVEVPASVLKKFNHDIYISYAQLDNEAQLVGQQGWVSAFHRSLEVRVGQLLGKKPIVFRASHGEGGTDEAGLEQIPESALLITVLSPRYLKSEWCNRELRKFLAGAGDKPRWGSKFRVFKVIKTPIPPEKHPPEILPLTPYDFYKVDPETGRTRELDQIFGPDAQREYWARLDDLAHDIAGLLEKLEDEAEAGDVSETSGVVEAPEPSTGAGKGTLYLSPPTHDLREEHDALRRDLARHGYRLLPDGPLPLVGDELDAAVREDLAQCRMSIHLVGRNYGIVPEGAQVSMVARQVDLAAERARNGGFNQILWLPPGVAAADERQDTFLKRLRSDFALVEGSDLLETSLEDLKTVVHQTLNPVVRSAASSDASDQSAEEGVHRVYLVCDQRDEEATAPLADFLFEKGFEVTLPIFEGDEAEVREDHEENLRLCDAVLLYYGAGNELWLRRKLREVQKISGLGRKRPMLAKGVWVAPPGSSAKRRFRTRETLVMAAEEQFSPAPLEPFLDALGDAS